MLLQAKILFIINNNSFSQLTWNILLVWLQDTSYYSLPGLHP